MPSLFGGRVAGRLAIGLADSGISSAGNLAVSVIVAHAASLSEFGNFAVAMLTLILATAVCRCMHGDPLVLRSRLRDAGAVAADVQRSTTSVLRLGTGVGLALSCGGLVAGLVGPGGFGDVAVLVVVSGAALPLLCLQDHLRWVEYARGASHLGMVNNAIWTVVSTVALVVARLALGNGVPAAVYLGLWAGSTAPAIAFAAVRGRIPLRPLSPGEWLRPHRSLIGPLVMDYSLTQATAQGAALLVGALSSSLAMAFIRKGQIWMGPMTVVATGILAALQPVLAHRAADRGDAAAVRLATRVGALASAGPLLYGALVWSLPSGAAAALVGAGWSQSRPFIVPLSVQAAASLMGGCLGLALRTTGRLGRQVRWRLRLAPAVLVLVALVTAVAGPLAAIWTTAAAAVVTTSVWGAIVAVRTPEGSRDVVTAA